MSTGPFIANGYILILGLLALYGLHRLTHLLLFRWTADHDAPILHQNLPHVTIQLPVFNERTVVTRLIRAVGAMDWPADRLELQVLDDSTDDTTAIAEHEVDRLRKDGIDARILHRPRRDGFKAGALDFGLETAKGDLVCVFDADFVPPADFLTRLVGHFEDSKIGMVQARWEHLNRDESALTRAQSTLLDGHFVIEHKVRSDAGLFFNFNGTAGIWRRTAIEEAGGWQKDTLTEDLDLSYRAQLAGWEFAYAPMVVAPAEIPTDIAAFKSQQHRWAKGSVQVLRKLARPLLIARLPLHIKLEAFAHLSSNVGYPLVLLLALMLPFSITEQNRFAGWTSFILFCLCTVSVVLFYERGQRAIGRKPLHRIRDVITAMSLGIGLCVSQTRAVLEGMLGPQGSFVRTPKRGDALVPRYRAALGGMPGLELLLAAWFAWALIQAIDFGYWGSLPFLLLFFSGFTWVGLLSLREWARLE